MNYLKRLYVPQEESTLESVVGKGVVLGEGLVTDGFGVAVGDEVFVIERKTSGACVG